MPKIKWPGVRLQKFGPALSVLVTQVSFFYLTQVVSLPVMTKARTPVEEMILTSS